MTNPIDISVITPAHNEELYIQKCIESVQVAAKTSSLNVEHIVVINRCTDNTEALARSLGCTIVTENVRNIGQTRNAGACQATGRIIVTIDADSWMSPNMLQQVVAMLESGKYVGGGVRTLPERWSLGIVCSLLVVIPFVMWHRVSSAGMFWCYKSDFEAINGFDSTLVCVEDVDFAKRLKRHGRLRQKRYGTIKKAHITTSCRKFDEHGDWYFVRNPKIVFDIFRRKQQAADSFYYDARG